MIKLPYGPHTLICGQTPPMIKRPYGPHTLICGQTPPMVNHPRVKPPMINTPYAALARMDKLPEYKLYPNSCPNGQVARMVICPNTNFPRILGRMEFYPKGHFNFTTTHAHMLCHILGLKQEVGDWLYGLDVSIKIHQTELQLLEKYLKEKENQLKEERAFENLDKEDLIGHLQKLGFTEERSISITNMLPRQLIALQYPSFWAIKYIQNMFDSHPLLSVFKQ